LATYQTGKYNFSLKKHAIQYFDHLLKPMFKYGDFKPQRKIPQHLRTLALLLFFPTKIFFMRSCTEFSFGHQVMKICQKKKDLNFF
jgi:hypothetical protein